MNLLRFAFAAAVTFSTLNGAAPTTPTCTAKTGQYPCTLGGTLLLLAQPTGNATTFVGNQGNSGLYIDDPQNPGLGAATTPSQTFGGNAIPFLISNFSLTTVNGQATMNGVRGSFTCGVTGAAVFALTVTTPQGILTLNCPHFTSIGTVGTVEGQINFLPTSALSVVLNISGRAPGNDTVTLSAFSLQVPDQQLIGSMPHIAAKENWTTTFTLVNKSTAPAQTQLSLFGDAVDPTGAGALSLPLDFPQQPPPSPPLLASSYSGTVAPNASLVIDTGGPQIPPVLVGSAHLASGGAMDGFAIFHQVTTQQEAVVPMETRFASSYVLPFDNTGGVVLGVAVSNVSAQAAKIPVVIRDDTGAVIGPLGATISLAGNGHTSFVLSTQYAATANIRGTIEFDTPAGGQISVLGIRTTPLGTSNTLTTIPALANVGTGGGSIAHLATGNGWQTTFVLVNTGVGPAQAILSFFADDGSQLRLPLTFSQTGMNTSATSIVQNLAPGAMLILQSAAPLSNPAPTTGSAQLATNGNVGGFVIFRYNPNGQEAVVPLESRNASSYVVAFDNTGGTATGIAVNSVSSSTQSVSIPVVVRDDAGTQFATDTLNLAANGHLAFTLAQDKYSGTANIRGTIEFGAPAGAQIGALGIRIPVAHTFTTLPSLAK